MTSTRGMALDLTFTSNPFSASRRERIPEKMRTAKPAQKTAATMIIVLLGAPRRLDEPFVPRRILNSAVSTSAIVLSDSRDNIWLSSLSSAPNHQVRRQRQLLGAKRSDVPN